MAFSAKARISLTARGALFLNDTPWTYYPIVSVSYVLSLPPNAVRAMILCFKDHG